MRNIKDTAINLEYFITNFPRAVHYMGLSLDVFPRIYNPLKDWVTSDEAYVRRLQEEMEELKREKVSLDSLARRHRMQAGGIQSKVIRSQHHSTTLRGRLVAARDERRACRKRELSVMDATVKIESELYQRKQALSRTLRNLSQDDPSLTTRREQLVDNSSLLSDQIARLEKKMAGMKTELKNVKKERIAAQKEFHRMQVLHEKNTKLEHDIKDDADDATQDVRDIEEERRILGEKVIALARIREIKNDPNTIKVIHKEGFAPGRKFDVSEGLEEACRTAASEIGRDWPMLSSPRRWSGSKFNFNLSARSESSVHGSEISKCGSTRSLDQWSRVSQEASSNALGRTLRSMHRHSRHSKADDDVVTTVN
ncbi:uncharacterized protein LOC101858690 [Aplysia californica]|nr:uncharacterized protein LOC101858690 [Aplysia californica]